MIGLRRVPDGRGDRSIGEDLEKVKQVTDLAIHKGGGLMGGGGTCVGLKTRTAMAGEGLRTGGVGPQGNQ